MSSAPSAKSPLSNGIFEGTGRHSGTAKSSNDLLTLPEVRAEWREHFQDVATYYRLMFPCRFTERQGTDLCTPKSRS
jgi:hypothetical protein